jgi:putative FmdB family regulatory protein
MPTYDYRCDECGDELEVWQSIKDDALTECPRCGGQLRKVMSPAGIVLKGSGFYKTDSRRGNGSGGDSKPANADGEKKSDTKSETKTEKKADKTDSKASSGKKD